MEGHRDFFLKAFRIKETFRIFFSYPLIYSYKFISNTQDENLCVGGGVTGLTEMSVKIKPMPKPVNLMD